MVTIDDDLILDKKHFFENIASILLKLV